MFNKKILTNSKSIIFSYYVLAIFSSFINYAITFVLAKYFDSNTVLNPLYQYVSLAKTFSGYGIIITTGINAYLARYITICYNKNDIKKANSYFNTGLVANLFISACLICVSVPILFFLERIITIESSVDSILIKLLFFLNIINFLFLAIETPFSSYVTIKNKPHILQIIKIVSFFAEILVLILGFTIFKNNIVVVGISLVAYAVFFLAINYYFSRRYTPELVVRPRDFSLSDLKEIIVNSIWSSINNLGNALNNGLDILFSNLYLTALLTNIASAIKTIPTILASLTQLIVIPFHPHLLKKYSDGDLNGVGRMLQHVMKISSLLGSVFAVFMITAGTNFFSLWVPNYYGDNHQLFFYLILISVIGFSAETFTYPITYCSTLTLKNRVPCFVTLGNGIINILSMFLFLKYTSFGIYAIFITTSVLAVFNYFIFIPIYFSKIMNYKLSFFYKTIFVCLIGSLISLGILYLTKLFYNPSSWLKLILYGCFSAVVVFCVFLFIVFDREQRLSICSTLSRIIDKAFKPIVIVYAFLIVWHIYFISSNSVRLDAKIFWPFMAIAGLLLMLFKEKSLKINVFDIWFLLYVMIFGLISFISLTRSISLYFIISLVSYYVVARTLTRLSSYVGKTVQYLFIIFTFVFCCSVLLEIVLPSLYTPLMKIILPQNTWDFVLVQRGIGYYLGFTSTTGILQFLIPIGIIFSLSILLKDKCSFVIKIVHILFILFAMACLLLTGRRAGPLILIGLFLLVFIFFKKTRIWTIMFVALFVIVFFAVGPERIPFISTLWSRITSSIQSGNIATSRLELWDSAFYLLGDRPLIGYGIRSFGTITHSSYVHNGYIQALFDLGFILGPIFIFFYLFPIVFWLYSFIYIDMKKISSKNLSALLMIIFFNIMALTESLFTEPIYVLVLLIFCLLMSKDQNFVRLGFENRKIVINRIQNLGSLTKKIRI